MGACIKDKSEDWALRHSRFLELMKMKRSEQWSVDMKKTKTAWSPRSQVSNGFQWWRWSVLAVLLMSRWVLRDDAGFCKLKVTGELDKSSFSWSEAKLLIGVSPRENKTIMLVLGKSSPFLCLDEQCPRASVNQGSLLQMKKR